MDGLDLALSPLQYMLRTYPEAQEQPHRQHLGSFGISGALALQPMYTLSGGQKNRVALAKVCLNICLTKFVVEVNILAQVDSL